MGIIVIAVKDSGPFGVGDMDDLKTGVNIYDFIAEEDDDLADLPTPYTNPSVAVGSHCYCLEEKKNYYLATTFLWTEDGNVPGTEALDSLEITTEPTKVAYTAGDPLDTTGFAALATYTTKRTEDLGEDDVTFSVNAGTTAALTTSDTTVTATYTVSGTAKTDTYSITVEAAPADDDGGDDTGGDA